MADTTPDITDSIVDQVIADFNPNDVVAGNAKERTFDSFEQFETYDYNVLRPAKKLWDDAGTEAHQYYKEQAAEAENSAFDLFLEDYEEADKTAYDEETMRSDMVLMAPEAAALFSDRSWIKETDFDITISNVYKTLGGGEQIGDFWTDQVRTIREGQIDGRAFINADGEIEYLNDDEEYLDGVFDLSSDVIMNDNYTDKDGRKIVGFEYDYTQADPRARVQPLLRAIYEGDVPLGELASRWDLADSWLKSNILERNNFEDILTSLTRSTLGVALRLGGGLTELSRSLAILTDEDNKSEFIDDAADVHTYLRSLEMSKADEDKESMLTVANTLDLAFDIAWQLLAVGGVAKGIGAGVKGINAGLGLITKGARMPGWAGVTLNRLGTWLTYGSIGASDAAIEAKKAGFGDDASAGFFMGMMLMLGAVGTSTSMMGMNWENRITRNVVKDITRRHLATFPIKEAGKNKATMGLAKRIVKDLNHWAKNTAKRGMKDKKPVFMQKTKDFWARGAWGRRPGGIIKSPKLRSYWYAGHEEATEEFTEVGLEKGMHHIWNAAFEYNGGEHPQKRDGFLTIHDAAFWEQLPMELIMSYAGGFAGGAMARGIPWMGGKLDQVLPYIEGGKTDLLQIALSASQKQESGLKMEKALLKHMDQMRKKGGLGSQQLIVVRDPKTGRLKKITDFEPGTRKPEEMTVGDANYNLILMQYSQFRSQTQGWGQDEDYQSFLEENPDIKNLVLSENYYAKKFGKNFKALNDIFSLPGDALENKMLAFPDEGGIAWIKWWKDRRKRKKEEKVTKKAEKAKEKEEATKATAAEAARDAGIQVKKPEPATKTDEKKPEGEEQVKPEEKKEETTPEAKAEATKKEDTPQEQVTTKSDINDREAASTARLEEEALIEEDAEALVANFGVALSREDAVRAVKLNRENQHMITGVTAERDFIISVLKKTPEFSILWEDDDEDLNKFGEKLLDELLRGDHRAYESEVQRFQDIAASLKSVEALIESGTIDDLLNIKLHAVNGKITVTPENQQLARDNFIVALNESMTTEDLMQAKKETIIQRGLFNTGDLSPEEEETGGYMPGETIIVDKVVKDAKSTGLLKRIEQGNIVPNYIQIAKIISYDTDENTVLAGITVVEESVESVYTVNLKSKTDTAERLIKNRKTAEQARIDLSISWSMDVEAAGGGQATEEKLKLQSKWVEDHKQDFVKLVQTNQLELIANGTGMLDARFDPTGVSAIKYIQDVFSTQLVAENEISKYIDAASNPEYISKFYPAGVTPVEFLPKGSTMDVKFAPIAKAWDNIHEMFDGDVPKDPDTDLMGMLVREFSGLQKNYVKVSGTNLFSSVYVDKGGVPLRAVTRPGKKLVDSDNKTLFDNRAAAPGRLEILRKQLERTAHVKGDVVSMDAILEDDRSKGIYDRINNGDLVIEEVVISSDGKMNFQDTGYTTKVDLVANTGVVESVTVNVRPKKEVFIDISEAKKLRKQLEVREAVLKLFTGEVDVTNFHNKSFLAKVSQLRVYNANIMEKVDFHAPPDLKTYDIYSGYFSYHIYDPVKHRMLLEKQKSGIVLSPEEVAQLDVITARVQELGSFILPNIQEAIVELDGMLKNAPTGDDEEALSKVYKKYIVDYGKTVKVQLTAFYDQEVIKDAISDETSDMMKARITALDIAIEVSDIDEGKKDLMKEILLTAEALNKIPKVEKEAIIAALRAEGRFNLFFEGDERADLTGKTQAYGDLHPMIFGNFKEYLGLSKNLPGLPHKPTLAQEKLSFALFTFLDQVESIEQASLTEGLGLYKNFALFRSGQASGKTSIMAPYSLYAYQKKLYKVLPEELQDYNASKGKADVLVAAHSKTRAKSFNKILKDAKIDTFKSEVGTEYFDTKELYDLLTSGESTEAIALKLDNIAVIAFDEITHIWAEVGRNKSDLSVILQQLEKVNNWRVNKKGGRRPIKFVGIGDTKQGGWREGFPTAQNWNKKINYNEAGGEINIKHGFGINMWKSSSIVSRGWRAKIAEPELVAQNMFVLENQSLIPGKGNITKVNSYFGPITNHPTGKLGGTEFIHTAEDFYSSGISKNLVDNIKRQLKEDPNFKLIVIDDEANKDPAKLKPGPLKELFNLEEEYTNRISLETIYSVQGGEADYVLAILPSNFVPRVGGGGSAPAANWGLLGMIIGRAEYYARVVVPTGMGLSSELKEMYETPAEVKSDFKANWEKFRDEMFADITADTTVSPKTPIIPAPNIVNIDNEEDDREEGPMIIIKEDGVAVDPKTRTPYTYDGIIEASKRAILQSFGKEETADIVGEIQKYEDVRDNLDGNKSQEDMDEAARIVGLLQTELQGKDPVVEDTEIDEVVETLAGRVKGTQPAGDVIREVGKFTTRKTIQMLEKAGQTITYAHTSTETKVLSPEQSIKTRAGYLSTLIGFNKVMDVDDTYHHIEAASGMSEKDDNKKAMFKYEYKLVTHEYGYNKDGGTVGTYAKDMLKQTSIVAKYIGEGKGEGKSFTLVTFVGKVQSMGKNSPLRQLIEKRNSELEDAVKYYLDEMVNNGKKPGTFDGFDKFNEEYSHITAELAAEGVKNANVKKDRVYGTGDAATNYGTVFIETDITQAMRKKDTGILVASTVGQLVTASDDTAKKLGVLLPPHNKNSFDGWSHDPPQSYDKDPGFTERIDSLIKNKEINAGNIAEFRNTNLAEDKKITTFKDKDGKNWYLLTIRGRRGPEEAISLAYDIENSKYELFFGITKDRRLVQDPNMDKEGLSEKNTKPYYTPEYKSMILTLDRELKISPTALDTEDNTNTTEKFEAYRKQIAETHIYKLSAMDSEKSMGRKFKLAGKRLLEHHQRNLTLKNITLEQLREIVKAQYGEVGGEDHVSISQPLVFTKGKEELQGKPFVIYSTSGKYKLNSYSDLYEAMKRLNLMRHKVDPKNPTKFFSNRDGLGIIMLDSPTMGFQDVLKAFTKGGQLSKGDVELERSMMSSNSVTNQRMVSMFGGMAEILAKGVGPNRPGMSDRYFMYRPDSEHTRLEQLWDDINSSNHGLAPVFTEESKKALYDRMKELLESGDAAPMITLSHVLTHMLRDGMMGGLIVTDPSQVEGGAHMGGQVKSTIQRHKKTKRPYTKRPDTAPILYIPPSIEVVPEGETAKYGETLSDFSISNFLRLALGYDSSTSLQVIPEVVNDMLGILDEIMYEYTAPGTLRQGMFVSPAAVFTEEKAILGWARLDNSAWLEMSLRTTVKGINPRNFIININNLNNALTVSQANPSTPKIIKKEFEEKKDEILGSYTKIIKDFKPSQHKDPVSALADTKVSYTKELETLRETYQNDGIHDLNNIIDAVQTTLDKKINAHSKPIRGLVFNLSDLTLQGGYQLFGIADATDLDEGTKMKLFNHFTGLRLTLEPEQFKEDLIAIKNIIKAIPNQEARANYMTKILPTINNLSKVVVASTLDNKPRLDELVKAYDIAMKSKKNSDKWFTVNPATKEAGKNLAEMTLNYSMDPGKQGNRSRILRGYLLADKEVRKNLDGAMYAIPGTQDYSTNPYILSRKILQEINSLDPLTSPPFILLEANWPEDFARLMEHPSMKRALEHIKVSKGKGTVSPNKKVRAKILTSLQGLTYPQRVDGLIKAGILDNNITYKSGSRFAIIANINGVKVPFYRSSQGTGGKDKGKWYPFFGFGYVPIPLTGGMHREDGWLIKGRTKDTVRYYDIPILKEYGDLISSLLDWDPGYDNVRTVGAHTAFKGIMSPLAEWSEFNQEVYGIPDPKIINGATEIERQGGMHPNDWIGPKLDEIRAAGKAEEVAKKDVFKGPKNFNEFSQRINTIIEAESLDASQKISQLISLKGYLNSFIYIRNIVKLTKPQVAQLKDMISTAVSQLEAIKTDVEKQVDLAGLTLILSSWFDALDQLRLSTEAALKINAVHMAQLKAAYPNLNRNLDTELITIVNDRKDSIRMDMGAYLSENVPSGLSEDEIIRWIEGQLENQYYELNSVSVKDGNLIIVFKSGDIVETPIKIKSGDDATIIFPEPTSLNFELKNTPTIRFAKEARMAEYFERTVKSIFQDFLTSVNHSNVLRVGDIERFGKDHEEFGELSGDKQESILKIARMLDNEIQATNPDLYASLLTLMQDDTTDNSLEDDSDLFEELYRALIDMEVSEVNAMEFERYIGKIANC